MNSPRPRARPGQASRRGRRNSEVQHKASAHLIHDKQLASSPTPARHLPAPPARPRTDIAHCQRSIFKRSILLNIVKERRDRQRQQEDHHTNTFQAGCQHEGRVERRSCQRRGLAPLHAEPVVRSPIDHPRAGSTGGRGARPRPAAGHSRRCPAVVGGGPRLRRARRL